MYIYSKNRTNITLYLSTNLVLDSIELGSDHGLKGVQLLPSFPEQLLIEKVDVAAFNIQIGHTATRFAKVLKGAKHAVIGTLPTQLAAEHVSDEGGSNVVAAVNLNVPANEINYTLLMWFQSKPRSDAKDHQGEHHNGAQARNDGESTAEVRDGVNVAVADRCHCNHHHPDSVKEVIEARLNIALERANGESEGDSNRQVQSGEHCHGVVLQPTLDDEEVVHLDLVDGCQVTGCLVHVHRMVEEKPEKHVHAQEHHAHKDHIRRVSDPSSAAAKPDGEIPGRHRVNKNDHCGANAKEVRREECQN